MLLTKTDYENILKLLETVEIKGASTAKAVAVIAHKIENRIATWYDGHPTGFEQVIADSHDTVEAIEPPPGG